MTGKRPTQWVGRRAAESGGGVAQRGFQSSSRVITASDQMLQDLVSIIR